jgi:phosphoserine aminotransferase
LKASQEASRLIGKQYVNVAVDGRKASKTGKFTSIPDEKEWTLSRDGKGGAMVYFCDNETVDGVEFPSFPKSLEGNEGKNEEDETIVVADMSSNFLSRKIDVKKYGIIFVSSPILPLAFTISP